MNLTVYLILFGMLVLAGFSTVVSALNRIANLLDSLRNDLKPLTDEARKREHEDREAQRGYG